MGVMVDQRRQRKKWIWGCTGGCLGFLIAGAVALYIIVQVLKRPVPLVPPEAFVAPQTEAFMFVRASPDDLLMIRLVGELASMRSFLDRVPARKGASVELSPERAREMVLQTAPVQLVLILQPGSAEGAFDRAAVLSIYRYSRLYGLVARSYMENAAGGAQARTSEYKGALTAVTPDGRALGIFQNNYMAADQTSVIPYWVERVIEERARQKQPGPHQPLEMNAKEQLKAAYGRLDAADPVLFACLNSRGELALLLSLMPQGDPRALLEESGLTAKRVVSLGGELKGINDRDAVLTLFLECADASFAAQLQAALTQVARAYAAESPFRDVKMTLAEGRVLKVEARVESLPEKVTSLVRYLMPRRGRPAA